MILDCLRFVVCFVYDWLLCAFVAVYFMLYVGNSVDLLDLLLLVLLRCR